MMHGDNKGLVMPPDVAIYQVVIIPIIQKNQDNEAILSLAKEINQKLEKSNVRVMLDDRDNLTSGRKYNEWELKGIPLRIEIGVQELNSKKLKLVRRCDGLKKDIALEGIEDNILLEL